MTITKDIWHTLTKDQKRTKMVETLTQLHAIQEGKHTLSGKLDQGRLASVKKDLETFVIDAAEWESNKQQKQF